MPRLQAPHQLDCLQPTRCSSFGYKLRYEDWLLMGFALILLQQHRQTERKSRSFAEGRRSPDPAAVCLDNALADSQANSRSWIHTHLVQTLEDHENLVGELLLESNSVVAYREYPVQRVSPGADVYHRNFTRLSELQCIADQVLKHLI